MKVISVISVFILGGFLLFSGCSEVSQPENVETLSDIDNQMNTLDAQFEFMERGGFPLEDAGAVLSLGWREMFRQFPRTTAEIEGNAFAVAFQESASQPPRPSDGIDIGSVFINYDANHLELRKIQHPEGGIFYTLFCRLPEEPLLQFVANEPYEFEITGSPTFDPLRMSITTPPALLDITQPQSGRVISPSQDLVLGWTGGKETQEVIVHVLPAMFPPEGGRPGSGGMQPPPAGGPQHRPGHGPGFLPPPVPPDAPALVYRLSDNPGTFSVPAADIQELIRKSNATAILCGISQLDLTEVNHTYGLVKAILHNGDRIRLLVGS